MPYTQIRFVGYAIDTAPITNPNGSETYLGLPNPKLDIEARCLLMQSAMNLAYAHLPELSPPAPPGSTLTVFLAPEFYLRGTTGAYQMDDVQIALALLQDIAGDPKWDDWVFAFGTIIGSSDLPRKWYDFFGWWQKYEVYNFSLFQQGGDQNKGPTGAQVIMKELMSGIDFISGRANPGGLLLGSVQHLPASNPSGPGRERSLVAYDGAGIFTADGITWALDICLDHLQQRLQRSPQLPGEEKVRVQLVPSCGAYIQPTDVISAPGGYVFNVDGHNGSFARLGQVQTVPPQPPLPNPQNYPVSNAPYVLPHTSPPVTVAPNQLYRFGAGKVVLYPPLPIPAPEPVPGSFITLNWKASPSYRITFKLAYDGNNRFQTAMCLIQSTEIDFHNNNYFLPLNLRTLDRANNPVRISVKLVAGSHGFDYGIWCEIHVADFNFDGNAVEFSTLATTPPEVCW